MIIPLVNPYGSRRNPNRPPKKWFYEKVAEKRREGYPDPERIVGHIWHHNLSASKKREILSRYENPLNKRPAFRRGPFTSFKERSMSRRRVHGRSRRATRRRHNPQFGYHRPTLLFSRHGWRRTKRSRLMRRRTFVNPLSMFANVGHRKHRRHVARHTFRRHSYRHNPAILRGLPFNVGGVAMGGVKIAGGIAAGMILMPVLVKYIPKSKTTGNTIIPRNFLGLVHVILGAVIASFIRKPAIKEVALIMAGTGVYDLIASNVTMLGLPPLANTNTLIGPASAAGIGSSYAPAGVGSSYRPALGSSYQGDDIAYGGDSDDELDLE